MFLSGKRAESDKSAFGSFWFEPVGVRTGSGVRVNTDSALTLSAVFRAVSLLSGHMAMLPVKFYQQGTKKQIKHSLLRLLNVRPNRWQNAFEWREMLQGHLELRGNCFNEIYSNNRGQIEELIPRHPDRVKIVMLADGDYRYRITNMDGSTREIARQEMWHIRGLSSDGIIGLSVIEYARESFGLGIAAQSYGARFFGNDAKPTSGWIEYPGAYKDKTQKEQVRESLQDAQSGMSRGKLMILDHGMKFHDVGPTNEDMQFLETRQHQVGDVARWFGIPPHKIGDLSKATFSNIEQQSLEYIQDALQPRGTRFEKSVTAELLFDDEEIDVRIDYKELMRGDSTARSAYYHNGILDGWLVRNEARDMEDLEPLDGLDEPMRPLNMIEEGEAEDEYSDQEDAEDQSHEKSEPQDDSANARLRAMVSMSAARISRRAIGALKKQPPETVFDSDFAELVSESMAISPNDASEFCQCAIDALADGMPEPEANLTAMLITYGTKR